MSNIKTQYGILNDAKLVGRYNTGEPEEYMINGRSVLNILGYSMMPLYEITNTRRKEMPSVKLYKDGKIKIISLQEAIQIRTTIGAFEAEKIVFYESGAIKRVFPLDGKLSGYWSEEDEYELAKEENFEFIFGEIKAKVIAMHFYESQELKSLSFWPKEIIDVFIDKRLIKTRIGITFYKDGKVSSCEPYEPTYISTPIGEVQAYDENAIGIHGEQNSLEFYEDGRVKSLITSTNVIEVCKENGQIDTHSPKEVMLFSNSDVKDLITVSIEFQDDNIIIDKKFKYNIKKDKFVVKNFGQKLVLFGDLNN